MYSSNKNSLEKKEHTLYSGPNELSERKVPEETPQIVYAQLWNEHTENEYLLRVKKQATQSATKIIETAMQEANELRKKAQELGYTQGEKNGKIFIENKSVEYIRYFESILQAMEEHSQKLFSNIEEEITTVIQVAVEKITGIMLEEERMSIIKSSFIEAMKHITQEHAFTIYVNQEDYAIMTEIVNSLQSLYPSSQQWLIKTHEDIPLGSCRFEDTLNTIDVNIEKRKQKVLESLAMLQFTKGEHE